VVIPLRLMKYYTRHAIPNLGANSSLVLSALLDQRTCCAFIMNGLASLGQDIMEDDIHKATSHEYGLAVYYNQVHEKGNDNDSSDNWVIVRTRAPPSIKKLVDVLVDMLVECEPKQFSRGFA
jgi:hypothetical protein